MVGIVRLRTKITEFICCIVECDTMYSGRRLQTFRTNVLYSELETSSSQNTITVACHVHQS
jgi:hypothetical protein